MVKMRLTFSELNGAVVMGLLQTKGTNHIHRAKRLILAQLMFKLNGPEC